MSVDMYQRQLPVEYGDVLTVTKYKSSDVIYIDIETGEHTDVRFVRLTRDMAADLILALVEGLQAIGAEVRAEVTDG